MSKGKTAVELTALAEDLAKKGSWIKNNIRTNEWIEDSEGNGWFNGYYDNNGNRLEGEYENGVRMTLTGQVFNIMGSIATDEQVSGIINTCSKYLKDEKVGGYRLNTNFNELKLDMGRCFGFAFGHKENGAMFSHMSVMYANALYRRNHAVEGYDVISSIYRHCSNFERSRIYPGIPEYINERGRGMYHYLTGSASWLLLTMLGEMYGVKGELGNLVLEPKLLAEQFDVNGKAGVVTCFADRKLHVVYENASRKGFGEYTIKSVKLDNIEIALPKEVQKAVIQRSLLQSLSEEKEHVVCVELQ
jgi:cellobiose phosphorylase